MVIVVGIRIYRGENKTCVDVVGCSTGIQGNRNISSKNGIKIVKINLVNVFDFFLSNLNYFELPYFATYLFPEFK